MNLAQAWEANPPVEHMCQHCGAIYAVTVKRLPVKDDGGASCVECGNELAWWNSTSVPSFELKKQGNGEPAERRRRPMAY